MALKTAIKNGIIYTGDDVVSGKVLLIDGEYVAGVIDEHEIPSSANVWDAGGANISPGLIDLQIYGAGGFLYAADRSPHALEQISKTIVASGTTSYLLTLATNTLDVFRDAMAIAAAYRHPAFLGLHLEGPYLNPKKRGAHPEELIRIPQEQEIEELLESQGGKQVKMMTVATELFDLRMLSVLLERGVIVSAGHSNADSMQATAAFEAGVQAVTHLFNAMSPVHHRASGLPGAVLLDSGVSASIIVDGIHVSYDLVKISKRMMGDRLFLITDAVTNADGGIYTHIDKGDHFALPDGTLSGSALTLLAAVGNCVNHADIPLDEALRMATIYPARLLGDGSLGALKPGLRADVLLFNSSFEVQKVMLKGVWID